MRWTNLGAVAANWLVQHLVAGPAVLGRATRRRARAQGRAGSAATQGCAGRAAA